MTNSVGLAKISGLTIDKVKLLSLFGAATKKIKAATVEGDVNKGVQFIGQTQGLIEDQPSVQELIERTLTQAAEGSALLAEQCKS